jgi:hypothetical protein
VNLKLVFPEERKMPGHRPATARQRLATLLALAWFIVGPVGPAGADVVNFQELLPFVDLKIPGWTMNGAPCGATRKQGDVMVSEARVSFKAGDRTLEIIIMDFLGKTIPFLTGQQLEIESSEETVRATEVQGFKALATFRRQDRQAALDISVAGRFWVKLDGEGIDNLEVLEKIAQQMDLKRLATLAR